VRSNAICIITRRKTNTRDGSPLGEPITRTINIRELSTCSMLIIHHNLRRRNSDWWHHIACALLGLKGISSSNMDRAQTALICMVLLVLSFQVQVCLNRLASLVDRAVPWYIQSTAVTGRADCRRAGFTTGCLSWN